MSRRRWNPPRGFNPDQGVLLTKGYHIPLSFTSWRGDHPPRRVEPSSRFPYHGRWLMPPTLPFWGLKSIKSENNSFTNSVKNRCLKKHIFRVHFSPASEKNEKNASNEAQFGSLLGSFFNVLSGFHCFIEFLSFFDEKTKKWQKHEKVGFDP